MKKIKKETLETIIAGAVILSGASIAYQYNIDNADKVAHLFKGFLATGVLYNISERIKDSPRFYGTIQPFIFELGQYITSLGTFSGLDIIADLVGMTIYTSIIK